VKWNMTNLDRPTVSVIIPTYNRAHLVGRAIRSVLNQTYQDFEIIVVDDGSTDNTEEVVKSFNDPRIRYIRHEKNRGGSAARNTGIRVARGEYIAFLDSDDEWLPMHISRKLAVMEGKRADGLISAFYVEHRGKWEKQHCRPKPRNMSLIEYILTRMGDARTSAMFFRKAALMQVMFDEAQHKHQDWDLAARFEKKFNLGIDHEATTVIHSSTVDRMSNRLNHAATQRFLAKHGQELHQETLARFCLVLAIRAFASEGRTEAFHKWCRKAWSANPHNLIVKSLLVGLRIPGIDKMLCVIVQAYWGLKQEIVRLCA